MVQLIGASMIDWQNFLTLCRENLEVMPNKALDDASEKLDQCGSFLACLAYMQGAKGRRNEVILDSKALWNHISYTFFVSETPKVLKELRERTILNITSTAGMDEDEVAVCTGTLKDWYDAVFECCSPTASKKLRILGDAIVLTFEKAGFSTIWRDAKRVYRADNTFTVEEQ